MFFECHNHATWESDAEDESMVPVVGDVSDSLSTRVLPLARPEQTFRQTRNGVVPEDLSKPRIICYECGLSFSKTENLKAHFSSAPFTSTKAQGNSANSLCQERTLGLIGTLLGIRIESI